MYRQHMHLEEVRTKLLDRRDEVLDFIVAAEAQAQAIEREMFLVLQQQAFDVFQRALVGAEHGFDELMKQLDELVGGKLREAKAQLAAIEIQIIAMNLDADIPTRPLGTAGASNILADECMVGLIKSGFFDELDGLRSRVTVLPRDPVISLQQKLQAPATNELPTLLSVEAKLTRFLAPRVQAILSHRPVSASSTPLYEYLGFHNPTPGHYGFCAEVLKAMISKIQSKVAVSDKKRPRSCGVRAYAGGIIREMQ